MEIGDLDTNNFDSTAFFYLSYYLTAGKLLHKDGTSDVDHRLLGGGADDDCEF